MIYDKPKILVIFKIVSMLRLDIIPKFCTPLLLKVTFKFENGRNSIFIFFPIVSVLHSLFQRFPICICIFFLITTGRIFLPIRGNTYTYTNVIINFKTSPRNSKASVTISICGGTSISSNSYLDLTLTNKLSEGNDINLPLSPFCSTQVQPTPSLLLGSSAEGKGCPDRACSGGIARQGWTRDEYFRGGLGAES